MTGGNGGTCVTVGEIVRSLTRSFRDAGLETPDLDARRLVSAATNFAAERLIVDASLPISTVQQTMIETYRVRRLNHEPVSRILSVRGFYGRDFMISPAVLDPRPDTETLVDLALAVIDRKARAESSVGPIHILDIGVGSGAILLTLLAERPATTGLGIDISDAALSLARINSERLGLGTRAHLEAARIGDIMDHSFDLIVANPPYVPTGDIEMLDRDVTAFDPLLALDGGPDGLDVYREVFQALGAARFKQPVALEFGAGQAESVVQLAHDLWLAHAASRSTIVDDLSGRPRCVLFEPHI